MTNHKIKSVLLMSAASLLMLQGCIGRPADNIKVARADAAQAGLSTDEQLPDPLAAHLNARKKVNTSPSAPSAGYHVTPDDPTHFHVLKLEPQMADAHEALSPVSGAKPMEVAQAKPIPTPVARPANSKAVNSNVIMAANVPRIPRSEIPRRLPLDVSEMEPAAGLPDISKEIPKPESKPEFGAKNAALQPAMFSATGVRIGTHPGKVRVVVDISGAAGYTSRLDNKNHELIIELPGADWKTQAAQAIRSPLVAGYRAVASPDGTGTTLEIDLAKPAKLITSMALPPNDVYGHRLVFDIGAL